jgi:hypothetical protein
MQDYSAFLASKRRTAPASGFDVDPGELSPELFDFQRHIVSWAMRRGRAAVWADTGLGKTRMQLEWLRHVVPSGHMGLILAPLGVTQQTIREAEILGIELAYVRNAEEATHASAALVISNYERLWQLDSNRFTAVVLDESSILKSYSGTTKRALVAAFAETPYRLACTATPAPNDLEELCNHADFLGIMSPAEMRSTFFIADSRGEFMRYRLKGHAKQAFYDWLASWAIACRTPDDLGFDGAAYQLPELSIVDHLIPTDWAAEGELFTPRLEGVSQRAQVRRETLEARVEAALDLLRAEPEAQWLCWCGLNTEADSIQSGVKAALPDANVAEVSGSDDPDLKAESLLAFSRGEVQVLVTKPSLAGFGLNFQACARMVFIGLSDSYELYYQAIRRCYRFGQHRPVHAHIVLADVEKPIVANVRAKERTAAATTSGLVAAIAEQNRRELFAGTSKADDFTPTMPLTVPEWLTTEEVTA